MTPLSTTYFTSRTNVLRGNRLFHTLKIFVHEISFTWIKTVTGINDYLHWDLKLFTKEASSCVPRRTKNVREIKDLFYNLMKFLTGKTCVLIVNLLMVYLRFNNDCRCWTFLWLRIKVTSTTSFISLRRVPLRSWILKRSVMAWYVMQKRHLFSIKKRKKKGLSDM